VGTSYIERDSLHPQFYTDCIIIASPIEGVGNMPKEKVNYYFDESGEKGFVRKDSDPTAFGLIAGIALPSRNVPEIQSKLNDLFSEIEGQSFEKLHATEIFADGENAEIRDQLFDLILKEKELLIICEAVYPKGVANDNEALQKIIESHEPQNQRIKVSKRSQKNRLYNILLEGILVKLDEICRIENSSDLFMITDLIDKAIWKEANAVLEYLCASEHIKVVTCFDPEVNKVLKGKIKTKVEGIDISVKHIKSIKIEESPSSVTLASDIVCNSIHHHLRRQIEVGEYPRLNAKSTFNGFFLAEKIALLDDNYLIDSLYSPVIEG
jgi:hypothetical protein